MARSQVSRRIKAQNKEIFTAADGSRTDILGNPAPPYKAGEKKIAHKNARRDGTSFPGRIERRLRSGLIEIIKEG